MTETTNTTKDTFDRLFFGSETFDFVWTPLHWVTVGGISIFAWPHLKKAINQMSKPKGSAEPRRVEQQRQASAQRRAEAPLSEGARFNDQE
jgi:hypothetical protein